MFNTERVLSPTVFLPEFTKLTLQSQLQSLPRNQEGATHRSSKPTSYGEAPVPKYFRFSYGSDSFGDDKSRKKVINIIIIM